MLNQLGRTSAYNFSIGEAAVQLLLTDSDTRILQSPRLRATDGQKAILKIGERIPIATGSFTSTTTSSGVETQFQYIDVGVNVEMTPTIHYDRDVTMKLSVEVSSQVNTVTISSIAEPVIGQQKTEQIIRMKDGEIGILAGLVKKQVNQNVSGWPGVGDIPLLKYLFTTQSHEVVDDELVFMLVPHVIRSQEIKMKSTSQLDIGTTNAVQIRESQPDVDLKNIKP
jgi:general secretion pathway protein D